MASLGPRSWACVPVLCGGHPWGTEHAEAKEDEESDSVVLHGSLLL